MRKSTKEKAYIDSVALVQVLEDQESEVEKVSRRIPHPLSLQVEVVQWFREKAMYLPC